MERCELARPCSDHERTQSRGEAAGRTLYVNGYVGRRGVSSSGFIGAEPARRTNKKESPGECALPVRRSTERPRTRRPVKTRSIFSLLSFIFFPPPRILIYFSLSEAHRAFCSRAFGRSPDIRTRRALPPPLINIQILSVR